MVKISHGEITILLDTLKSFEGDAVVVEETISRDRINYHLATRSRFTFVVEEFAVTLSGLLLFLWSENGDQYCMAGDDVVSVALEDCVLTIKEHYEEKTVRQTVIKRGA